MLVLSSAEKLVDILGVKDPVSRVLSSVPLYLHMAYPTEVLSPVGRRLARNRFVLVVEEPGHPGGLALVHLVESR
jgi:hypothetical protein